MFDVAIGIDAGVGTLQERLRTGEITRALHAHDCGSARADALGVAVAAVAGVGQQIDAGTGTLGLLGSATGGAKPLGANLSRFAGMVAVATSRG